MSRGWTLRHFDGMADYRACVALQEEIWGAGFAERVPAAILKVSQEVGGVSAGAFDHAGRLVGFVFGLTGPRKGTSTHWSDMLGVAPAVAGQGVGYALKTFQRDAVLDLGVADMLWTFDPLRARNAHLNLNKLGVIVREYRQDMYGASDSPLHAGLGTDRLVALWPLRSERTKAHLERARARSSSMSSVPSPEGPGEEVLPVTLSGAFPVPETPVLDREGPSVRIAIPSDIGRIMDTDPSLALAWRNAVRDAFECYLGRGYEALGLARGPVTSTYLLQRSRGAGAASEGRRS